MGGDTPQTRTLRRAVEIVGSAESLAQLLLCEAESLAAWLSGQEPTPSGIYLRALDIVSGRRSTPTPPRGRGS